MKKHLLALFCALVLLTGAVPPAAAQEGEALRAADTLATLGLVNGTADGSYALEAPATRAQAAVMLVRLAGAEDQAAADNWFAGFRDVPAWAAAEVNYAVHQGWIDGSAASLDFFPDRTVTADEWCTFLLRMLGYSDRDGDFSTDAAALFAQHIGLISLSYSGELSRGDLFSIAAGVLRFSGRETTTLIQRLVETGAVSRAGANALGFLRQELTARQAAEQCLAAVFRLDSYERQIEVDAQEPSANASGFFISADGLAVTNYHSIDGAIYATATLSTGECYPIERVLYYDAGIDIAVIQVSKTSLDRRTASAFACLEIAPSGTGDVRVGDTVHTISNPLGLGLAVSTGVISARDRVVDRYTLPCLMSTADISQGSSGGALLNVYGQVIGVTSGAYTYGNSMYLAVPIDPVLQADLSGQGWTLAQVKELQSA